MEDADLVARLEHLRQETAAELNFRFGMKGVARARYVSRRSCKLQVGH